MTLLVTSLHGQTDIITDPSSTLTVVVKKYEVLQTEFFTEDQQLVYADVNFSLQDELIRTVSVDNLLGTFKEKPQKKSTTELILAHYPNSNSVVVLKSPTTMPTSLVSLDATQFRINRNNTKVGFRF